MRLGNARFQRVLEDEFYLSENITDTVAEFIFDKNTSIKTLII